MTHSVKMVTMGNGTQVHRLHLAIFNIFTSVQRVLRLFSPPSINCKHILFVHQHFLLCIRVYRECNPLPLSKMYKLIIIDTLINCWYYPKVTFRGACSARVRWQIVREWCAHHAWNDAHHRVLLLNPL
jgi:hypothetical protein